MSPYPAHEYARHVAASIFTHGPVSDFVFIASTRTGGARISFATSRSERRFSATFVRSADGSVTVHVRGDDLPDRFPASTAVTIPAGASPDAAVRIVRTAIAVVA